MNRDNFLFALMGMVLGFVLAYPVFEALSVRQPPLRAAAQGGGAPAGAPGMQGGPGGAGGPAVEEIRRLREYVANNPQDADAILALANLNLSVQDLIRARDLLEQYVELRPGEPQVLRTLGNLHFETNQYEQARDRYEQYLEIQPGDADVLTDLGTSYRNLGEPQRALEIFRQVQQLKPDDWISRFNQVVVLAFDLGDFDAAEEALTDLQRLQPDNSRVSSLAAEVSRRREAAEAGG